MRMGITEELQTTEQDSRLFSLKLINLSMAGSSKSNLIRSQQHNVNDFKTTEPL